MRVQPSQTDLPDHCDDIDNEDDGDELDFYQFDSEVVTMHGHGNTTMLIKKLLWIMKSRQWRYLAWLNLGYNVFLAVFLARGGVRFQESEGCGPLSRFQTS